MTDTRLQVELLPRGSKLNSEGNKSRYEWKFLRPVVNSTVQSKVTKFDHFILFFKPNYLNKKLNKTKLHGINHEKKEFIIIIFIYLCTTIALDQMN